MKADPHAIDVYLAVGSVMDMRVELTQYNVAGPFYLTAEHEQYFLEWYLHRAAVKVAGVFPSTFWESLVLQASSREPAILHAILALSAAHKQGMQDPLSSDVGNFTVDQQQKFMFQHYIKAIRYLQPFLSTQTLESMHVALIFCLVSLCLEVTRGQYATCQVHLQSGMKLLKQIADHSQPDDMDIIVPGSAYAFLNDDLIGAIFRLNIYSALFGHHSEQRYFVLCGIASEHLPGAFSSLKQARKHLEGLLGDIHFLSEQYYLRESQSSSNPLSELSCHQERIQAALVAWLRTYNASRIHSDAVPESRDALADQLLRVYHTMATIMASSAMPSTGELTFDQHTEAFVSMIVQILDILKCASAITASHLISGHCTQRFSFTADMGIILPLYYTAIKCRVPGIRRQAVELLRFHTHKEGLLDGQLAARIAEEVLRVEEGSFFQNMLIPDSLPVDSIPSVEDLAVPVLPETNRICRVQVMLPSEATDKVVIFLTRRMEEGWYETIQREC
ncbi:hypothetical protein CNMCM5623_003885 [Aspergillus felis]|uniref:C6 zinc finger domain protein n=1 Tax=Aspergillus felis TaxID=1287682 RepID=A0A8H6PRG0_9EURO|nr:hypothetical protein CNMCM5623_003885 [Aspergillus felis]